MSLNLDMTYNTTRDDIELPEYGRTIQMMIHHAKTIQDPRKRQKTVEAIIGLMQMLNPSNKNVEDYREKLWNHAFRIADYELDVTPPPGITIRREDERLRLEKVVYPQRTQRFRHYGHNVQTLISKAIDMPDGVKKEGFVEVIASYMKLAYKTWNKEHYVSDDVVKDDLEILSQGQLELHEGHSSLDLLANSATRRDQEVKRNARGGRGGRQKMGGGSGGGVRKRGGGGGGNGGGGQRRRKK